MSERAELEARLAQAQAKNAAIDAQRAAQDELAQLRADVEQAERAVKEAPFIEKAVQEHGALGVGVLVVETRVGSVVVKRPHAPAFRRFADAGSMKSADVEKLVRGCLVYPDANGLDVILEEQPATLQRLADAVVTLAGVGAKERAGK